ncbi:MAG: hypothetical protein WDW36_006686 [Sanguina aurantia]
MLKNAAVGEDLAAAADLPGEKEQTALPTASILTLAATSLALSNLAQVGGIPTENQSSSNAAVEPSSVEDDSPDTQAAKLADETIALSAQLAEMVKQQDLEDAAAAVAAEARAAAAAAAAAGLARLAVAQEANAKVRQQMAAFALRKSPHHTTVTAAVVAQPPPAHTPTTPQPTPTELEISIQRGQQLKTKGLANDKAHQGNIAAFQQGNTAAHADLQAKRKLDSDSNRFNQQQQQHQRQQQQAQLEAEQREQQQQQTNDFLVNRRSVKSAAADDRARHATEYEKAFVAHRESGMSVSEAQKAIAREDPRCGEHMHEQPEREEHQNYARAASREPSGEQGGRGKFPSYGSSAHQREGKGRSGGGQRHTGQRH